MKSNRPYLIRAFYEWIVDNDCTPYVVIDAHHENVEVPQNFVTNGQIILNIAPRAVTNFKMNNEHIKLSTLISGHKYFFESFHVAIEHAHCMPLCRA